MNSVFVWLEIPPSRSPNQCLSCLIAAKILVAGEYRKQRVKGKSLRTYLCCAGPLVQTYPPGRATADKCGGTPSGCKSSKIPGNRYTLLVRGRLGERNRKKTPDHLGVYVDTEKGLETSRRR
ncbi:hypothetical protein NDU88_009722 [Pleurodeles waltl]|uniref:Uncharacterized protein n=1 Tax=Pleurodeles waltl TaxID=8319 RepID=A0AAV7RWX3_PLEWA|nr:hypothetical protein NDU88_009722 [Pleurodeles waltl]